MDESDLRFPDVPRSELESTIGELLERAQKVLTTQGRLRSLLAANRAVVGDLDPERVLARLVEAAVTLVRARYGALGVVDPEGRLQQFIHVGMSPADLEAIGHLPEGHGLLGAVIDSGEPIRAEHLGDDARSVGFPEHHPPMDSFLGVPVTVRGETFGNLYLTNREDGPFTEEDEELVGALAATAGIAIQNARLYEEARSREKLSGALGELRAVLLSPGTEDMLGAVAERIVSVIPASLVTVTLLGPGDGQIRIEVARGAAADALVGAILPSAGSLALRAITSGTIAHRPAGDTRPGRDERFPAGPAVAVALSIGGDSIAALCLSRDDEENPFTRGELENASEFAEQAGHAIALARARLDQERLGVIRDRGRIARDLHENVIQRLFTTGLGLQALAATDPSHAEALESHVAAIDDAIADIRASVFAMSGRDASGAVPARSRLLDVLRDVTATPGDPAQISFTGPVDRVLTGQLADDVVAVVRGGLNDVACHAHAEWSAVEILVTDTEVTVVVEDDGAGMPRFPSDPGGTHHHLAELADARGGHFVVRARLPAGTRARWTVPVSP